MVRTGYASLGRVSTRWVPPSALAPPNSFQTACSPARSAFTVVMSPPSKHANGNYFRSLLILLRHRIGVAWVVMRGALQHGHRARVVARATIRCRRVVAIELATCRSGRTGGASRFIILGNLRCREL